MQNPMQSELSDSAWQHLTAFLSHCSFPCREVAAFPLPHATAEEGSMRSLEQKKWDQESGMLNLPGMCFSNENSHKDGPCHSLKHVGAGHADPARRCMGHPCKQDRCCREGLIMEGYAQQTTRLSGGRRFGCYLVTFSKSCLFQTLQSPCCETTIIMFTYLVKLLIHGDESVRQQHFSSPLLMARDISPLRLMLAHTLFAWIPR